MSRVYDNWERLIEAVLDREDLRRLAYCPSLSSTTSSADFDFDFSFEDFRVSTDPEGIPAAGGSSSNRNQVGTFTFRELAAATRNFHSDCVIDEGGFGKLYRGCLQGSNQVVMVKQFGRNGSQGKREFLVECLMLSILNHPNIINVMGYCGDGDNRLLVYEYLPLGSLYNHLHEPMPSRKHLDWNTRMKIAAGVAKGLEYLHHTASPPVILRNLKPSNILLGEDYNPKISNFGFGKLEPVGDKRYVSTTVMGTVGYCAPEYAMSGQLSVKADVYSFGIILLEIISGRKAIDVMERGEEENIVAWARPLFGDQGKFPQLVDPVLHGEYPLRPLYQAIAVAAMCLQEPADLRPTIADVARALTYLSSQKYERQIHPTGNPT